LIAYISSIVLYNLIHVNYILISGNSKFIALLILYYGILPKYFVYYPHKIFAPTVTLKLFQIFIWWYFVIHQNS